MMDSTEDPHDHDHHSMVHDVRIPCDIDESHCFRTGNDTYWNVTGGETTFPVEFIAEKTEEKECKQGILDQIFNRLADVRDRFSLGKRDNDHMHGHGHAMNSNATMGSIVVNADHVIEFSDNSACCVMLPFAAEQWGQCNEDTSITMGCCPVLTRLVTERSSASSTVSSLVAVMLSFAVARLLV